MSGKHQHRNISCIAATLDRLAKLVSVHERHGDVEQNQVEVLLFEHGERLISLGGLNRAVLVALENRRDPVPGGGAVVDDQDQLAAQQSAESGFQAFVVRQKRQGVLEVNNGLGRV